MMSVVCLCFVKQKTAYEMRISDGVQTCSLPISTLAVARVAVVLRPGDMDDVPRAAREQRFGHRIGAVIIVDRDKGQVERTRVIVEQYGRSAERRVGTECVRTCRYRWSPEH